MLRNATWNKHAKAGKTRKSPGTLGLKKFGPGKLRVKKVWAKNICIDSLAELDNFKKINPPQPISGNTVSGNTVSEIVKK